MNLSLARPQWRNQSGSEPNLHGWAGIRSGPGSFLDSEVNKGRSAELLILDWERRCPSWRSQGSSSLLSSWMLSSPSDLWDPPVSFHEVPLFLLKLATVTFYNVVPRKPTLICAKDRHWRHLSLPKIRSLKKNYSNALRNGGGISDIMTGRGNVGVPGTPSGVAV